MSTRPTFLLDIAFTARLLFLAAVVTTVNGCDRRGAGTPLAQCEMAMAAGQYGEAIPFLQSELKKTPDDADLLQWLGLAYWKSGQAEKATEFFEAAQRLLPSDPRPSEYLGYVEMARKRWPQAEAALGRALRASPKNNRAWTALAVVRMGTNNLTSAQLYLKEAIRLDPKYAPALYNLAWLYYYRILNTTEASPLFKRYLLVSEDRVRSARAKAILRKIEESTNPAPARSSSTQPAKSSSSVPVRPTANRRTGVQR